MQIYSMVSQKGGTGKSTLARQFAVLTAADNESFLIDRDPQQTTAKWWKRRQPDKPELIELNGTPLTEGVASLKSRADGLLFIDTRPAVEVMEAEAAQVADMVIVPVRSSPDDLEAVVGTLKLLRRLDKRAVLVVNAAKNSARALTARAALASYPFPVCPHHIADRTVYLDAAIDGLGVSEMRSPAAKDATEELQKVWGWIQEVFNER